MSTEASKELWSKILNNLGTQLADNTEALRVGIESRIGQIYIFDPVELTNTVNNLLQGTINFGGFLLTNDQKTYINASFNIEKFKAENITAEEFSALPSDQTLDKIRTDFITSTENNNSKIQTVKKEGVKLTNWKAVLKACTDLAEYYEVNSWNRFVQSQKQNIGKHTLNERRAYILNIIKGGGEKPLPLTGGKKAYLFKNHRTAQEYQAKITEKFLRPFMLKSLDTLITSKKEDAIKTKNKLINNINSAFLNVGHGATMGASVVASQVLSNLKQAISDAKVGELPTDQIKALKTAYNNALRDYATVGSTNVGVNLTVEQEYFIDVVEQFLLTDQGRFNGEYISVISLQSVWGNNFDSKDEKAIKETITKSVIPQLQQLVEVPGSLSLLEAFERVIFYSVVGKNEKYFKVKGKTLKQFKRDNSFSIDFKATSKVKSGKTEKAKKVKANFSSVLPAKKPVKKVRVNKVAPSKMEISPLQILNYINSRLPQTMEKNMGFPALESQTGRFAQSVKALNVIKTKQGFPSIEYTYQRDPYQVFEVGIGRQPWASTERDPRRLIDRSIREIATEMLKTRIFTRRI